MRYFFLLALTKAFLARCIGLASAMTGLVHTTCPLQRFLARERWTITAAIDLTSITVTANNHLAVTTGTIE